VEKGLQQVAKIQLGLSLLLVLDFEKQAQPIRVVAKRLFIHVRSMQFLNVAGLAINCNPLQQDTADSR